MNTPISRPEYMDWLRRWQHKDVVKVLSGVRRCGKSTLLKMFAEQLILSGVNPDQIIQINLEDLDNEPLTNYKALHSHITSRLKPKKMNYLMLDEIQQVDQFERAIDSLAIKENVDIYLTGSNAYFMSSELATHLTGRYVELKMLPLSFAEFSAGLVLYAQPGTASQLQTPEAMFELYRKLGSFPYLLQLVDDAHTAREYLQDIYNSILLKDVVQRLRITEAMLLERIAKVLAGSVGSFVSPNKIANTLVSSGTKIDQKTVNKYIDGLAASLLFYEVNRWDVVGRQVLPRQSKFYAVDSGLRNMLVASSANDLGHELENIVYLELLRRGAKVYVGTVSKGEIDFVAQQEDQMQYIQVCASLLDETTRKREFAAFEAVNDGFPKKILTLDRVGLGFSENGVEVINAIDWLLGA